MMQSASWRRGRGSGAVACTTETLLSVVRPNVASSSLAFLCTAKPVDVNRITPDTAAREQLVYQESRRGSSAASGGRCNRLVGLAVVLGYAIFLASRPYLACSVGFVTAGGFFAAPELLERGGVVAVIGFCYRAVFRWLARKERIAEDRIAAARAAGDDAAKQVAEAQLKAITDARQERFAKFDRHRGQINLGAFGIGVLCAGLLVGGFSQLRHNAGLGVTLVALGGIGAFLALSGWYVLATVRLRLDFMRAVNESRKELEALVKELKFSPLAAVAVTCLSLGAVFALIDAAVPAHDSTTRVGQVQPVRK
jgi:hypothetical protein